MSRRGIQINDWLSQIFLGIFFFCIGTIFLTMFLSADPDAMASLTITDWVGVIIFMLIPTAFMDLGLLLVIWGWKGRHRASGNPGWNDMRIDDPPVVSPDGGMTSEQQKTVQAISGGISMFYAISLWIQRLVSVAAAAFAILVTAIWWLMTLLDPSQKASLNGSLLLALGLVLISYIVIVYIMLLRKPRAGQNAQ